MERTKEFLRQNWFYIVAFTVPWIVMVVHSLIMDTWLTGNGSLLTGDMSIQLVPFYHELWNRVHAGDFSDFTWTIAGGIDFQAVLSYLISPFSLLVLMVPQSWIADTVQFIMILKWALTAVSMVYFFYHTRFNTLREHKRAVSLFLGLVFALSNGMVNYMLYIQFMDVMICFPFLLLLIEKMVDEKRWKLYYVVLVFCMFSNTYIAYQLCLFLILWFFMQFTRRPKVKFKKFMLFAGSSVLAAVTSVSAILSILVLSQKRLESANSVADQDYMSKILVSLTDYIKQLFVFADIAETSSMIPNVYCTVMVLTLALLFVFVKMRKRDKCYMSFVALFMTASIVVGIISYVWHLFNVPNSVYHRFINYYTFALLFLVLQVIIHLKDIRIWHVIVVGAVEIGAFVYTFFSLEQYEDFLTYLVTALCVVLYLMLLIFYCKNSIKYKNMIMVIVVFGLLEASANAYNAFGMYDAASYDFESEINEVIEKAELAPGEKMTISNASSNMFTNSGKASVSGFVSGMNGSNRRLYDRLGMPYNGSVEYTVKGASPVLNLFFNLRYGVSDSAMEYSDAELVEEGTYMDLYRINRLAGLGYMVQDDILDWNIYGGHCFEVQNSYLEKAVRGEAVFTTVTPEIECQNAYYIPIERNSELENDGSYVYEYTTLTGDVRDSIQASFEVEEDMDLYLFEYSAWADKVAVFIDGEQESSDTSGHIQNTIHVGNVKKGQKVTIVIYPRRDGEIGIKKSFLLRFAKFDEEAYQKSYEKLSKNVYEISEMESDYIKGSIHVDEAGIMMTSIQALEGFTVLVDGVESGYFVVGGAMIGVPLEEGDHTIEFIYDTPYRMLGIMVSATGVVIFLILCLAGSKRKKTMVVPQEDDVDEEFIDDELIADGENSLESVSEAIEEEVIEEQAMKQEAIEQETLEQEAEE